MKTIPLSQGKVALVDDVDFEWICQWSWYAARASSSKGKKELWYAVRGGPVKQIQMHREIASRIGFDDPDHIDFDGLNNQRLNLRPANRQQQARHRRKQAGTTTSRFKGVSRNTNSLTWRATIVIDLQNVYLGTFQNEINAAKAYNQAAKENFGEFAELNVIPTESQSLV